MSDQIHTKSLALIGAGRWGKNLARNLRHLGVLHSLCDVNENLLDGYQQLYPDVKTTSNFNAIFENPAIDKVMIAAPAIQHYSLAKRALECGKDVFVEKPLCLNCSEGEELVDLAEKNRCILMVGHLLQYHPCIIKLHEMIHRGDIGTLQYITSNRLNLGAIRTEENALWSFAPHDISVILSLSGGSLPLEVSCFGGEFTSKGVADTTLLRMRFDENLLSHVYVSWLHPFKEQKLVVIGSKGMIVFDDTCEWNDKLLFYRSPVILKEGQLPEVDKSAPERVSVVQKEPLLEECLHFLECCQNRSTPRTDGEEGLRVLQVLQAAQKSLEGGDIKVKPSRQPSFFSHETAVVDKGASIGEGTKIWHFSHIMEGARIGKCCNIGQNVVISPDVSLGDNVKVQNNVSVYSGVLCEDDVFLGPSVVFTNVKNPRSAVNRRGQYEITQVRRGATIGANATIVCGVEIGEYAFIGAGAVVVKDVPPYALVVGNPGRHVGWMSCHGEKLNLPLSTDDEAEIIAECPATGERYSLHKTALLRHAVQSTAEQTIL